MQHGKADHPYFSLLVSIGSCGLLLGFLALNDLFWFSGSQILDTLGSTKIWRIVAAFVAFSGTLTYIKVLPLSWHASLPFA